MGLTLERKHGRGRDLARGAEKNIASGGAVLWRHNKSKMANGRHFEDR